MAVDCRDDRKCDGQIDPAYQQLPHQIQTTRDRETCPDHIYGKLTADHEQSHCQDRNPRPLRL